MRTNKPLPFGELSPEEFERLCLWLIEREGYLSPEHLGEAGSDQGRDITAHKCTPKGNELWYFQCKRYKRINAATLIADIEKISSLGKPSSLNEQPAGIVFLLSDRISAAVREKVKAHGLMQGFACEFWARTELDMLVKKYPPIVEEFFFSFGPHIAHQEVSEVLTPEPDLLRSYIEQVALQRPYILWSNENYIDRNVSEAENLFSRLVMQYESYSTIDEKKPERLEKVLTDVKKLILIGEPGLGKTTSLLHLAWNAARQSQRLLEASLTEDIVIPIFVELKYYNGESELEPLMARRVDEILRASSLRLGASNLESTQVIRNWLTQSKTHFLLLLDGINEVRPEFHTAVRGILRTLINSPHSIVITCRERDYDQSLRENLTVFVLQKLKDSEIREYLIRVLGEEGRRIFEDNIDWKMRTLAANPLMLWLISMVVKNDFALRLPKNRGKLFQQFVSFMPYLRTSEGIRATVPSDVVVEALAQLGYEMQKRGRLTVSLNHVRHWHIPVHGNGLEDVLCQAKEWRFLKSDGRLGEDVEFLHHLFLEYFATVKLHLQLLHNKSYDQTLAKVASSQEWEEVIVTLAGIVDSPVDLIKWLSSQVTKRRWRKVAFLAKRCWETTDAAQDDEGLSAVIGGLIAVLRKSDKENHWEYLSDCHRAIELLGNLRHPRAVEPLVDVLESDEDELRFDAAEALTRINIRPVIDALYHEEPKIRAACASALGETNDLRAVNPLIVATQDRSSDVRSYVICALGKLGDIRAIEPLINALHDPASRVRWDAVASLAKIGSAAVDSLIAAIPNEDVRFRPRVIDALGETGDRRAVEPLLNALKDKNLEVRRRVVYALGKIGDPKAINSLLIALRDSDVEMRERAAFALGEISDARGVQPLIDSLRDEKAGVRCNAAQALGKIKDHRAVKPLIMGLTDPHQFMRYRAANALGEIGDPLALPELELASHEKNGKYPNDVAKAAKEAIKTIRKQSNPTRRNRYS